MTGSQLISELFDFVQEFEEEEEGNFSLLSKITDTLDAENADAVRDLEEDIERVLKLFYLRMKVQNKLKTHKEDYFI